MTEVGPRVAAFLAKYDPAVAAAARDCRARLHALIPRGFELVYDNYNALVFGFGPTEKAGQAVLSLAVFPRWVALCFLHGATLPDPDGLLHGTGSQVRHIRLASASDLDRDDIRRLMLAALATQASAFAAAGALRTLVKSVSAKQRPRRSATLPRRART